MSDLPGYASAQSIFTKIDALAWHCYHRHDAAEEKNMRADILADLRAALSAPAGMQLVPVKPSKAMLRPFIQCPADELELAWVAALELARLAELRAAP